MPKPIIERDSNAYNAWMKEAGQSLKLNDFRSMRNYVSGTNKGYVRLQYKDNKVTLEKANNKFRIPTFLRSNMDAEDNKALRELFVKSFENDLKYADETQKTDLINYLLRKPTKSGKNQDFGGAEVTQQILDKHNQVIETKVYNKGAGKGSKFEDNTDRLSRHKLSAALDKFDAMFNTAQGRKIIIQNFVKAANLEISRKLPDSWNAKIKTSENFNIDDIIGELKSKLRIGEKYSTDEIKKYFIESADSEADGNMTAKMEMDEEKFRTFLGDMEEYLRVLPTTIQAEKIKDFVVQVSNAQKSYGNKNEGEQILFDEKQKVTLKNDLKEILAHSPDFVALNLQPSDHDRIASELIDHVLPSFINQVDTKQEDEKINKINKGNEDFELIIKKNRTYSKDDTYMVIKDFVNDVAGKLVGKANGTHDQSIIITANEFCRNKFPTTTFSPNLNKQNLKLERFTEAQKKNIAERIVENNKKNDAKGSDFFFQTMVKSVIPFVVKEVYGNPGNNDIELSLCNNLVPSMINNEINKAASNLMNETDIQYFKGGELQKGQSPAEFLNPEILYVEYLTRSTKAFDSSDSLIWFSKSSVCDKVFSEVKKNFKKESDDLINWISRGQDVKLSGKDVEKINGLINQLGSKETQEKCRQSALANFYSDPGKKYYPEDEEQAKDFVLDGVQQISDNFRLEFEKEKAAITSKIMVTYLKATSGDDVMAEDDLSHNVREIKHERTFDSLINKNNSVLALVTKYNIAHGDMLNDYYQAIRNVYSDGANKEIHGKQVVEKINDEFLKLLHDKCKKLEELDAKLTEVMTGKITDILTVAGKDEGNAYNNYYKKLGKEKYADFVKGMTKDVMSVLGDIKTKILSKYHVNPGLADLEVDSRSKKNKDYNLEKYFNEIFDEQIGKNEKVGGLSDALKKVVTARTANLNTWRPDNLKIGDDGKAYVKEGNGYVLFNGCKSLPVLVSDFLIRNYIVSDVDWAVLRQFEKQGIGAGDTNADNVDKKIVFTGNSGITDEGYKKFVVEYQRRKNNEMREFPLLFGAYENNEKDFESFITSRTSDAKQKAKSYIEIRGNLQKHYTDLLIFQEEDDLSLKHIISYEDDVKEIMLSEISEGVFSEKTEVDIKSAIDAKLQQIDNEREIKFQNFMSDCEKAWINAFQSNNELLECLVKFSTRDIADKSFDMEEAKKALRSNLEKGELTHEMAYLMERLTKLMSDAFENKMHSTKWKYKADEEEINGFITRTTKDLTKAFGMFDVHSLLGQDNIAFSAKMYDYLRANDDEDIKKRIDAPTADAMRQGMKTWASLDDSREILLECIVSHYMGSVSGNEALRVDNASDMQDVAIENLEKKLEATLTSVLTKGFEIKYTVDEIQKKYDGEWSLAFEIWMKKFGLDKDIIVKVRQLDTIFNNASELTVMEYARSLFLQRIEALKSIASDDKLTLQDVQNIKILDDEFIQSKIKKELIQESYIPALLKRERESALNNWVSHLKYNSTTTDDKETWEIRPEYLKYVMDKDGIFVMSTGSYFEKKGLEAENSGQDKLKLEKDKEEDMTLLSRIYNEIGGREDLLKLVSAIDSERKLTVDARLELAKALNASQGETEVLNSDDVKLLMEVNRTEMGQLIYDMNKRVDEAIEKSEINKVEDSEGIEAFRKEMGKEFNEIFSTKSAEEFIEKSKQLFEVAPGKLDEIKSKTDLTKNSRIMQVEVAKSAGLKAFGITESFMRGGVQNEATFTEKQKSEIVKSAIRQYLGVFSFEGNLNTINSKDKGKSYTEYKNVTSDEIINSLIPIFNALVGNTNSAIEIKTSFGHLNKDFTTADIFKKEESNNGVLRLIENARREEYKNNVHLLGNKDNVDIDEREGMSFKMNVATFYFTEMLNHMLGKNDVKKEKTTFSEGLINAAEKITITSKDANSESEVQNVEIGKAGVDAMKNLRDVYKEINPTFKK